MSIQSERWRAQRDRAEAVVSFVFQNVTDANGQIQVHEAISALASIVGERCIQAAGDFDPRNHDHIPGQQVFSDKVNELLCGDSGTLALAEIPPHSVFGTIRDHLFPDVYPLEDFPTLGAVFETFAGGHKSGTPQQTWGRPPLSVGASHVPGLLPLKVTYESREIVDTILGPLFRDPLAALATVSLALALVLEQADDVMDPKTAITLAFETANGTAKMAPMTAAHLSRG